MSIHQVVIARGRGTLSPCDNILLKKFPLLVSPHSVSKLLVIAGTVHPNNFFLLEIHLPVSGLVMVDNIIMRGALSEHHR